MARIHKPVLLAETLATLAPAPGETALDCTAGRGGHACALAEAIGPTGTLVLNDLDAANLEASAEAVRALAEPPRIVTLHGNFADAPYRLTEQGLEADVALADLGYSSTQIDDPERGFSFRFEGPLDMRYDPSIGPSAAELVNTLSEEELGEIIREFGEERAWRRVASILVAVRDDSPIDTTDALAELVRRVVGRRPDGKAIDPATRTFQALRIAANDEMGNLDALLDSIRRTAATESSAVQWLSTRARVGVISFHSLEDRRVKQAFADLLDRGLARTVSKRLLLPTDQEIATNPRSRSARLRVLQLGADSPEGGTAD